VKLLINKNVCVSLYRPNLQPQSILLMKRWWRLLRRCYRFVHHHRE